MRGTGPSAVVVGRLPAAAASASASAAAAGRRRLHVVARSGRHRFDALEVDEQVDGADDQRQRRHDD